MNVTATDAPASAPDSTPTLSELLWAKLKDSPAPLTVKELAKGLPKPKKVKAAEFEESLPSYLANDVQSGRVFRYPSGKAGVDRYWSRDEKHAIREAVLAAAATPLTVADLVKKATVAVQKVDKGFADGVVRDLIREERLFEYPPKKKGGQPLFGAEKAPPPPHPLDVGKAKTAFGKLVDAARKLLSSAPDVTASELLVKLKASLSAEALELDNVRITPAATGLFSASESPTTTGSADVSELETRIAQIVQGVPSMLLSDLRMRMPPDRRGSEFDAAVIRLAEDLKVVINADADPRRFSDEERTRFVRDADGQVYTTIAKRS